MTNSQQPSDTPPNSIFDTVLTVFDGINPNPLRDCSLSTILTGIGSSFKLKTSIDVIRHMTENNTPKYLIDKRKKALPGVTFGGTFSHRNKDGIINHSRLVLLDFDKVIGMVETRKRMAFEDEHVIAAWISPSGTGIKLLVEFADQSDEGHASCFNVAAAYFADRDSLIADPAAADWTRLSYLSFDKNICVKPVDFIPVAFYTGVIGNDANDDAPSTTTATTHKPKQSKKTNTKSAPLSLTELDKISDHILSLHWNDETCPTLAAISEGLPMQAESVCVGWLSSNSTACLREAPAPHGPNKQLIGPGARDHLVSRFAYHVGERLDPDIAAQAVEAFVTDCILSVEGDEYDKTEVAKHKRVAKNKAKMSLPSEIIPPPIGSDPRVKIHAAKTDGLLAAARKDANDPTGYSPKQILESVGDDGKTPFNESTLASATLSRFFTHEDGTRMLLSYAGYDYEYDRTQWKKVEATEGSNSGLAALVHDKLGPMGYHNRTIQGIAQSVKYKLSVESHHHGSPRPPCRLDNPTNRMTGLLSFTDRVVMVTNNGEDVVSFDPLPHFFSPFSIPHPYYEGDTYPNWEKFLNTVFSNDSERKLALQEWFGYCLMPSNHLQKMALLIGPRRSGKGTTATILQRILGHSLSTQILSDSMSSDFVMQSFIGKLAVIIDDVNEGGSKNGLASAIDMLKSITGSDTIQTNRKNKDYSSFDIACRFTFTTNSLPRMPDDSGALRSRFVVITYDHDNTGKEDLNLMERLTTEIPGIIAWSMIGLRRLLKQGRFTEMPATEQRINDTLLMSTPIAAFAKEHLIALDETDLSSLPFRDVYNCYVTWARDNGSRQIVPKSDFAHRVATLPGFKIRHMRTSQGQLIIYGVRLTYPELLP